MNGKRNLAITYDPSAVFNASGGISANDLSDLAPGLDAARAEVLADAEAWSQGKPVSKEKTPLDAGFMFLPDRLLDAYRSSRAKSELKRILDAAEFIRESVDRVVILGIGGSYMGARALFEARLHPYHNELSRAERNGAPRVYFEGNNVDNDASLGLLDLLGAFREPKARKTPDSLDHEWALLPISKGGATLETAVAFRQYMAALRRSVGNDLGKLAERIIPVTGSSGRLANLVTDGLRCRQTFEIPEGVGGRFSIFCAVGLLPAAVLGLDIIALLEGAVAMNERFRLTPVAENPVLAYVGVGHAMESDRNATIRVLSTWGKGLEATGLWYDQLLSESLGKKEKGATPLTCVNTRDLHSRGQQHQEGKRDKLITNLIVDRARREPLAVGRSDFDQDELNELSDRTLPEIMTAAIEGTNKAYAEVGRPTADLRLPTLDEFSLGQLFQMLMLATVVEGRLIDVNPYGQPGVESYKKHMNAFLKGK